MKINLPFTEKELYFLKWALEAKIDEMQNQIVTCPDSKYYASALQAVEADKAQYEALHDRIIQHIETVR